MASSFIQRAKDLYNQRVAPILQRTARSPLGTALPPLRLFNPQSLERRYIQGQVIDPVKQGVQALRQPGVLNKASGAAQIAGAGFSVTPPGVAWNLGTGALTGATRTLRTGQPLRQTISQATFQPTSFASEGLGIRNPVAALGIDVLAGNPKGAIKSLTKLKPQTVAKFRLDPKTFDELVRAEDMLMNPKKYLAQMDTGRHATVKGYNLAAKTALKEVQRQAADTIDRVAAKYLPDADYYKLKTPQAQLKRLVDLSQQNKLANVPGLGFVGDKGITSATKAGGESRLGSQLQPPQQKIPTPPQPTSTTVPLSNGTPPGQLGPGNAVQRVIDALGVAKPIRASQEAIYTQVRRQQAGALSGIGGGLKGEQGYFQKLGQLKGEMPKVEFENIRKQVSQTDVDELFNTIEKSNLTVFEKVTAQTGLAKLFGQRGGQVPTEGELKLLNDIFPAEFVEAVLAKRPMMQKLFSGIQGALNLPRAIMATADLSAPLRQGIFMVGRPKQWVPAFGQMFRYAFSQNAYDGLMDSIKAHPNYKLMRESNLSLTDMSPSLLKREEAFMSNIAEKIPGIGSVARGSNRAYSGFLNKLRADVFNDLVTKAQEQNIPMEGRTLQDLASFINSATGRGNMHEALERAAPVLNATFFSPRLMASRLNLLNPVTYVKYDPFVRKEALKSLVTFGGTAASVLTLADLAGAEVGKDPRSADFGKIKIGNTRYDILGGFQQYVKLGAQLATGQLVSSQTGKVMTLGEGYKPLTRKDIIFRFLESKEAPIASFISSLLTGQTSVGEPVNVPTEVVNRFVPMLIQDLYELAKDRGSAGQALVMGWPAIFGAGTQTYGKQELVRGKNPVGQERMQVRPIQGLAETVTEKIFGPRPIGSSSSYNVDTYYQQLKAMPKEEAAAIFDEIRAKDPDLAKKLIQVIKDEQKGITVQDKTLKEKGVSSGDRALAIAAEFKRRKTKEEKAALWDEYVKKGIITKEISEQLSVLADQGKL